MSAFAVSKLTIDRTVTTLREQIGAAQATDPTRIGRELMELNRAALAARYGDKAAGDITPAHIAAYRHEEHPLDSKVARLKAVRCFLYQYSEGSVPRQPLYKIADCASRQLALDIAQDLPEYDRSDAWQ